MAARVGEKVRPGFASVSCAFLQFAEPGVAEAIEACVRQGASGILLLPYFLSAGRHVPQDIPEQVRDKRRAHPDVEIEVLPYLGSVDALTDLLAALVP